MPTQTQNRLEGRPRELLESPNIAYIATLRRDGTPQVVPVWVHVEDGVPALNTAEGRAWPANVERDARITLCVADRENPYEYVEIRGRVRSMTREGADEHIDMLAKKYLDADTYPFRKEGEVRLKVLVEPERVRHYGG